MKRQQERVILCRIGYMTYYAGTQIGDREPIGGGRYTEEGTGHEIYNFRVVGDWLYGFVMPYDSAYAGSLDDISLNLRRIDPACQEDELSDVRVIFFARRGHEGQVIIGWYNDATAYTFFQHPSKKLQREDFPFNFRARRSNCVLLPTKYRTCFIPRSTRLKDGKRSQKGKPGRANAFYLYNTDGTPRNNAEKEYAWLDDVLTFANGYSGPNLLTEAAVEFEDAIADTFEQEIATSGGQGFRVTKEARRAIESHSMRRAIRYLKNTLRCDDIVDVSKNRSYDIHCKTGGKDLMVEVKGTQTRGESILITKNEYLNAERYRGKVALYILHSVKVTGKEENTKASGGKEIFLNPWDIKKGDLNPIGYVYTLKKDG